MEIVHVRRRRRDPQASERAREIVASDVPVHSVELEALVVALTLLDEHPDLPTRDAVHVVTARNRGIDLIISTDKDFDRLPGLERIDPADGALLERLAPAD